MIHSEISSDLRSQRFLFLDVLRGLASLYVVLFHFYSILKEKTHFVFPRILDFFLSEGTIVLRIFFALSGFVIAYSVFGQNISPTFLGHFFLRRSLRLDPPYWFALFLTLAIALLSVTFFTKPADSLPSWNEIVINIFYLQDFFRLERIIQASWTLCLEIQLYLFFVSLIGLLVYIQRLFKINIRGKFFDSPIFVITLVILFLLSLSQHLPGNHIKLVPGLFTPYWYNFFIGSMLCWIYMNALSLRYFWACCACLLFFFSISLSKQIAEALLVALTIYAVIYKKRLNDMLAFPPLLYLGKISYSLYLTHWLLGGKLADVLARRFSDKMDVFTGIALISLCVAIAIATAHFFYLWVEYPSLRWSRRLKKSTTPLVVTTS